MSTEAGQLQLQLQLHWWDGAAWGMRDIDYPSASEPTPETQKGDETDVPDLKTCPDCGEQVPSAARVCRFCGCQIDLAEKREAQKKLPFYKRDLDFFGQMETRKQQDRPIRVHQKTPASCCGCSCIMVLIATALAMSLSLTIFDSVSLPFAIALGLVASVLMTHAANLVLRLFSGGRADPLVSAGSKVAGARPGAQ